jgi:Uma2 family endonuclease
MTLVTEKRWNYEDYLKLEDDKRYEIVGGKLYMVPAPDFFHQYLSANIEFLMRKFIEEKALGYVVYAPTDVILDEENIVQPDILFISKENKGVIKKKGIFGAPDLVVEIVSTSSQYMDTFEKKELYEKFKIKEYWIVSPYMKGTEILSLNEKGKYALFSESYLEEGKAKSVKSKVLDGFELNLEDVFREEF